MPDTMRSQMEFLFEGLKALDIPIYKKENFEADDVIGTIATKAKKAGHNAFILTGDRDSFQLVDKEGFIKILIPSSFNGLEEYDTEKVFKKMEVYPEQIIDYKALSGDSSDNIPGIKGIGHKTAVKLLGEYKTLENIYQNIDKITQKQIRTDLPEFRVGDTIKVNVRIIEGKRERIQAFEGIVIAIKGSGVSKNYTVRKKSSGIGVERTFPINSPVIDSIEVVRTGRVRQAKLGYIRTMVKQPKIKERRAKETK